MPISFTPVTTLGNFRFWCQKVLPAVYDDSLSYYELMCKIAETLNEEIGITNDQTKAIIELQEFSKDIDGRIEEYVKEFIRHDPGAQQAIREAVNGYIDSIHKGTTYAQLKDLGFLYK